MTPKQQFELAYRACRLSLRATGHKGTQVRIAANAVRGAKAHRRSQGHREDPGFWPRLERAHEKAFESRAYWLEHFPATKGNEDAVKKLRRSVNYLMWEAWLTLAIARKNRGGDTTLLDLLEGCRNQYKIALAAYREVKAGNPGLNALAVKLMVGRHDLPTEAALLVAEGVLARSEPVDLQRVEGGEPLELAGPLLDEVLVAGGLVDHLVADARRPDLPVLQ